MSEIRQRDQVELLAGALAGHTPLGVEASIAAAFQLVDEITAAGWEISPRMPSMAEVLARQDPGSPEFGDDPFVTDPPPENYHAGGVTEYAEGGPVLGPRPVELDVDEVATMNDYLVGVTGSDPGELVIVNPPGQRPIPRPAALRLAAWLAVLADPMGDDFAAVLEKVRNT